MIIYQYELMYRLRKNGSKARKNPIRFSFAWGLRTRIRQDLAAFWQKLARLPQSVQDFTSICGGLKPEMADSPPSISRGMPSNQMAEAVRQAEQNQAEHQHTGQPQRGPQKDRHAVMLDQA